MSDAQVLRRLRVRRWKPPSPEFIYHLLMSLAGLIFIANSVIRLIRGKEIVVSVIFFAVWSLLYLFHREKARQAQVGAVAPVDNIHWTVLVFVLMAGVINLCLGFL